ncbi:MAG: hypothetical protein IJY62_04635 [Clostridia bacterium]|nr:hypothetical protein [Clostridia bacterium]
MQENTPKKDLGFADVIRILFSKIVLLLIVTVATAIVGALSSFVFSKVKVNYGASVKYDISVCQYRASDPSSIERKENLSFEERNLMEIVDELSSGAFNVSLMAQLKNPVVTDPESPDFNAKAFDTAFRKFNKYVTYSYDSSKNGNAIIVNVSVPKNEALAKDILALVKKDVPAYVAENITVPLPDEKVTEVKDGNTAIVDWIRYTAACEEISHSYCHALNSHKTTSKAVQWGLIAGVAGLIVGCLVVLIGYKPKTDEEKTPELNKEETPETDEK